MVGVIRHGRSKQTSALRSKAGHQDTQLAIDLKVGDLMSTTIQAENDKIAQKKNAEIMTNKADLELTSIWARKAMDVPRDSQWRQISMTNLSALVAPSSTSRKSAS